MSKVAAVGIVFLFGTGCATERAPLQAMLLPPVDGKVALWINQPAYFAVLGVGPERGTEVLYQQTALEGVPASGYVYVPMRAAAVPAPELVQPDADYEQVYLVASDKPIDLSTIPSANRDIEPATQTDLHFESMRSVLASSQLVDGYRVASDTIDRLVCVHHPPLLDYWTDLDHPDRVYRVHEFQCPRDRHEHQVVHIASRTFFTPMPKVHPPGKGFPPRIPPGIQAKSIDIDRAARYLAAKDEWHALTHNGQPGTELARSGYAPTWSGRPATNTGAGYSTRQSNSAPASTASTHVASSASPSSAPSHH